MIFRVSDARKTMKYRIWLIYCTVTASLVITDLQNRFSISEESQNSSLQNGITDGDALSVMAISEGWEDDDKSDLGVRQSRLVEPDSVFVRALPFPKHDALRATNISPLGADTRRPRSLQVSQSATYNKQLDRKRGIIQMQKHHVHSSLQNAPLPLDSRVRSEYQSSVDSVRKGSRRDHSVDSIFNADMKVPQRQPLGLLAAQSSSPIQNQFVTPNGDKRLQGRGILLPRTIPGHANTDKNSASSGTNIGKITTKSKSGPSRNPTKANPSPSKSSDGDRAVVPNPNPLTAKAGIQIQGLGIVHTVNPSDGIKYFPGLSHIPSYHKSEHHDQAAAGGKVYPHPSGRIVSIAAHAEGRNVQLRVEPERHSTAYYEFNNPDRGNQSERYILMHGEPTQRHFGGPHRPDKIRVVARLIGPGYVSAIAHNRGIGKPPDGA